MYVYTIFYFQAYYISSTIPLSDNVCIFDMIGKEDRDGNYKLSISVARGGELSTKKMQLICDINISRIYSAGGVYIAQYNDDPLVTAFGNCYSVYRHDKPENRNTVVWSKNEEEGENQNNSELPEGFVIQGILDHREHGTLVCLWNKEFDEKSFGKVFCIENGFEIFADKNRRLYVCPTYIAENRNGDICVSDTNAVVVTDALGVFRFRYEGTPDTKNFDPYGICCNSSCNIIVADMNNNTIHIIGPDGKINNYIKNIGMPRALCIGKNDDLYVGEWGTDSIKVYSKTT